MKFLIVAIISIAANLPIAALENYTGGSRSISMGNCGVTSIDVWSVSNNQAALAFLTNASIAIQHQQRYLMKELGVSDLAFAIPLRNGALAAQLVYSGYSKYHETKAGLAYAHKLGEHFSAGIQLDYFKLFVPQLDNNVQQITFEAGLLSQPTDKLTFGLHVFNPLPENWKQDKETELATSARFGVSYLFDPEFMFCGETQFDFTNDLIFRMGAEYSPIQALTLRMGISSGLIQFSYGIAYSWNKLTFGFAFSKHETLGYSPSIDLIYVW